jgi:hypothetical protein
MEEYQEFLNFSENREQLKYSLISSPDTLFHFPLTSISLSPTFTTLPIYNFEPFVPKTKVIEPNEETLSNEYFEPSVPEIVLPILLCTS